jgi:HK97 family phage prohead protease
MQIERRYIALPEMPVRLEERTEGQAERIAGYASVTYDGTPETEYVLWQGKSERAVERIAPGAFAAAIERGDDVRALFNHDPSLILGRSKAGTLRLSVDAKGLAYSVDAGDTTIARDVMTHLRRGDVSGSSFGFRVESEKWTESRDAAGNVSIVRDILSVRLFDVGPVTFPAYAGASSGVRSADGDTSAREAYAAFRQANESQKENRALNLNARRAVVGLL